MVELTDAEVQAVLTEHTYLKRVMLSASEFAGDRENDDRYDDLVQCLRDALEFYSSRSGA